MAEIILVRHGQASFGANNYDQLSELGYQQSRWLGEHWSALGNSMEAIVIGGMERHRQTAESVLAGLGNSQLLKVHDGLNEYNFQGLLERLQTGFPDEWQNTGNTRRDYFNNIKKSLERWIDGSIASDGIDTWQSFHDRILAGFNFASEQQGKRVLVVSSGGPIAVILGHVLGLDSRRTVELTLQIKNTSTSSLLYNRMSYAIDSINDVSHLLSADKQQHITFS